MSRFNRVAVILAMAFLGCARERYAVRGSVVDSAGKPLENAFVSWWRGDCGDHERRTPNALGMTDEAGNFELDFTSPAPLEATGLSVQKGGYQDQCFPAPNGLQLHVTLAKSE